VVSVVVLFPSGHTVTASLYNHAVASARKQTKTLAVHKAARLIVRNLSFKVCIRFIFSRKFICGCTFALFHVLISELFFCDCCQIVD